MSVDDDLEGIDASNIVDEAASRRQTKSIDDAYPAVDSFRRLVKTVSLTPGNQKDTAMTAKAFAAYLKTEPKKINAALKKYREQVDTARVELTKLEKAEDVAENNKDALLEGAEALIQLAVQTQTNLAEKASRNHSPEHVTCAQDPACDRETMDPELKALRDAAVKAIKMQEELSDAEEGGDGSYPLIGPMLAESVRNLDAATENKSRVEPLVNWYEALTETADLYKDLGPDDWETMPEAPMELTYGEFLVQTAVMQQFKNRLSNLPLNDDVDQIVALYNRANGGQQVNFDELVAAELAKLMRAAKVKALNDDDARLKEQMILVLKHTGISQDVILKQEEFSNDEDDGAIGGEEVQETIARDAALQMYRSLLKQTLTDGTYAGPLKDKGARDTFFSGIQPGDVSAEDRVAVYALLSPNYDQAQPLEKMKQLTEAFSEFFEPKLQVAKDEASVFDPTKEDEDVELTEEELAKQDKASDSTDPYLRARNNVEAMLTQAVAAKEIAPTKVFNFDVPDELLRRKTTLARSYNVALTRAQYQRKFGNTEQWDKAKLSPEMKDFDSKVAKLAIIDEELSKRTNTDDPEYIALQDRLSAYTKELIRFRPSEFASLALTENDYWYTNSGQSADKETMYQLVSEAASKDRDAKQRQITEFVTLRDAVDTVRSAATNPEFTVGQAVAEWERAIELEIKHPAILYNIGKMGVRKWLTNAAQEGPFTMDSYDRLRSYQVYGKTVIIPTAEDLLAMDCADRVTSFAHLQKFAEDMGQPVPAQVQNLKLLATALEQQPKTKQKGEAIVAGVERATVVVANAQAAVVEAMSTDTDTRQHAHEMGLAARRMDSKAANITKRAPNSTETNAEIYLKYLPEIQAAYQSIKSAEVTTDPAAFVKDANTRYKQAEEDVQNREASADILDVILKDLEELRSACAGEMGSRYFGLVLSVLCKQTPKSEIEGDLTKMHLYETLKEIVAIEAPNRDPSFLLAPLTKEDERLLQTIGKEYWIQASMMSRCDPVSSPYLWLAYKNAMALLNEGKSAGSITSDRTLQRAFLCIQEGAATDDDVHRAGLEFDNAYWDKTPTEQRSILLSSPLRKQHLEDYMLGLEKSDEAGSNQRLILSEEYDTTELASRLLNSIVVSIANKIRNLDLEIDDALSYDAAELNKLHPLVRAMLLNYAEEVLNEDDDVDPDPLPVDDSENDTDDEDDNASDAESSSDDDDDDDVDIPNRNAVEERRADAKRLTNELGSTNMMLQIIADMVVDYDGSLDAIIVILKRMLSKGSEHVVLAALNAIKSQRMSREQVLSLFQLDDAPDAAHRAFLDMLAITNAQVQMELQQPIKSSSEAKRIIDLGMDVNANYWQQTDEQQLNLLINANKKQKTSSGRSFAVPHELLGIDMDYNASLQKEAKARGIIEDTDGLPVTFIGRNVAQRALRKLLNPTKAFEWFKVESVESTPKPKFQSFSDYESSDTEDDFDFDDF
ncbi:MAG: hypothetical protein ACPGR8_01120 [Limisphaerales bacterium]